MTSVQYRVAGRTARDIARDLETAVLDGALRPGTGLPTVRALAADLGVAPGTVAAAYTTLRERGLIETRGRLGTVVRERPATAGRAPGSAPPPGVVDLAAGQPAPELLPALDAAGLAALAGPAAAPAGPVLPALVERARARLDADGVPTGAVTVAGGGLDAIARVLAAGLRAGDAVAVEDPGWPNLIDLVAGLGLRLLPVAVDAAGPVPAALRDALRAGARAVVVTTRAHNPTGASVTPERAAALREVLAGHPHTLVVEDDHAAELAAVPLAPLAGTTSSWAFVRSLSKPYGPDLRVAAVAGDATTVAGVEARLRAGTGWVSTLLQRLAVHLWDSPDAAAAVATAAATYDTRRAALVAALAGHGVAATGATGLNVWVPVRDEATVAAGLVGCGWAVAPGSRFRQRSAPGVRVTVSRLADDRIDAFAADLARVLGAGPAGGAPTA